MDYNEYNNQRRSRVAPMTKMFDTEGVVFFL